MAFTGECERPVELNSDSCRAVGAELMRRAHRPYGVRTRWPDTDFEEVEYAGFHLV
jgi:hypothetical protein